MQHMLLLLKSKVLVLQQIKEFSIVGKFLAATNPLYNEFVAANSST